ncbi:MAG: imidazoleglycerol-phosphate dehydratase [Candidatus Omnitrophica bacterium]|nr:imidazoleglycerol-phosphate dehydratase [Candidatus Omnitrophota bacterium]
MSERRASMERKSNETQIKVDLNVDGKGKAKIKTPIGLLSHMIELFTFHGFFDLNLEVTGDTHIDIHHTNEDIGIVLGKAFKKALGEEKAGIRRFGSAFAPMEATLGHCVVDISGRGYLKIDLISYGGNALPDLKNEEGYSIQHLEHFLESFAHQLGANIVVTVKRDAAADLHTVMETVFKSLGLALDQATAIDPRREGGVPSTKGIID